MCIRDSLKAGHKVRIVQNRTGEEIAKGKVLSSQCMFSNAVQHERDLGIDFWTDTCPPTEGINFIVPNPDAVSYTHLDVYKRQARMSAFATGRSG